MTDQYQREWIDSQERRAAERQALEKVILTTIILDDFNLTVISQEKARRKQSKTVKPAKVTLPKKKVLVDKDPKSLFRMSKFRSGNFSCK